MILQIAIVLSMVLAGTAGAAAQSRAPAEKIGRPAQPPAQPAIGSGAYAFSPWTKFCGRDKNVPAAPQICLTMLEVKHRDASPSAGVALIEGTGKTMFRVTLPAEAKREAGARIAIDGEKPRGARFVNCNPRGCLADFEVAAEFVAQLKTGRALQLLGTRATGQPMGYVLPLAGFAAATRRSAERATCAPVQLTASSVQRLLARAVAAVLVAPERFPDLRVAHRFARLVGKQVLLRHVGDVFAFGVLGEQVVKRLVLARTDLGGNRVVPFLGVGELRIDVEHDAAKRKQAVLHHRSDRKPGRTRLGHDVELIRLWPLRQTHLDDPGKAFARAAV